MKLKKIILRNFQSYRRAVVRLHPHVNIFYGLSMAGKSALIRAIKKVTFNKPGDYKNKYHSDFAKNEKSFVKLFFEDGTVELSNTKAGQVYTVDNTKFRKFGASVPDEVRQFVNLNEINFAFQSANPFDIHKTTDLTREINLLTKHDIITAWIKSANKKISDTNNKIKFIKEEIKDNTKELKRFKPLKQARPLLIRAKRLYNKISLTETNLRRLKDTKERKQVLEIKIEKIKNAIKELEEVLNKMKVLEININNQKIFIEKIVQHKNIKAEIKRIKRQIRSETKNYIKSLGNVCQYCFQKIDRNLIRRKL